MEMTPATAGLVLALTVSMCCVAGFLALRKLQRADPAEIF
jgi:ABC-type antimicrobial peptide transport system permease subunit